ncbi:MAG TPA: hypothetical protein VFM19_05795 [Candidatus Limnocylindria bacterium]|nr:hypothetical protein [Candidatus Limnocylindria bacterium]
MLNSLPMPQDLPSVNDARVAQWRHEREALRAYRSDRRPVRRWLGRLLVRLGLHLAAEPSLRPARSL